MVTITFAGSVSIDQADSGTMLVVSGGQKAEIELPEGHAVRLRTSGEIIGMPHCWASNEESKPEGLGREAFAIVLLNSGAKWLVVWSNSGVWSRSAIMRQIQQSPSAPV